MSNVEILDAGFSQLLKFMKQDGKKIPRLIDEREASDIIESRKPRGAFIHRDGSCYVGIDNREGEAFTEEFHSMSDCLRWLMHEELSPDLNE